MDSSLDLSNSPSNKAQQQKGAEKWSPSVVQGPCREKARPLSFLTFISLSLLPSSPERRHGRGQEGELKTEKRSLGPAFPLVPRPLHFRSGDHHHFRLIINVVVPPHRLPLGSLPLLQFQRCPIVFSTVLCSDCEDAIATDLLESGTCRTNVLITIEGAALEPPVATTFFIAFTVMMMQRL